jgi:hypothetical protein
LGGDTTPVGVNRKRRMISERRGPQEVPRKGRNVDTSLNSTSAGELNMVVKVY